MAIKPVSWLNDSDEVAFGFDTETMKETMPEIVKEVSSPADPENELAGIETNSSVNISAVISILTKAMQELNEKVENLEEENNTLKREIKQLKSK